jgi:DNA-binding GntR family transcriptional regulator
MEATNFREHIDRPRSLVEDITANLSDSIFKGKLHPGQPISETALQRMLGVRRAPLREALLKLEGQGLVKIVPRRGAFVLAITPWRISEIFTIKEGPRRWGWPSGLTSSMPPTRTCSS